MERQSILRKRAGCGESPCQKADRKGIEQCLQDSGK